MINFTERNIDEILSNPRNARNHPRKQINHLKKSIETFGFITPVVIKSDGTLLGGHGRVEAAKLAGLKTIPVITNPKWTKRDEKAYAIFENRIAEMSKWDAKKLNGIISDLHDDGFSLEAIGYNEMTFSEVLPPAKPTDGDPNERPRNEKTRPKINEIWQVGEHRILVGDSTDHEAVDTLLAGAKPVVMVTDPPYGVNYNPKWRNAISKNNIKNTRIYNDHTADWEVAYQKFEGNHAFIWMSSLALATLEQNLNQIGMTVQHEYAWVKNRGVMSRGIYHWQHEMCTHATRNNAKLKKNLPSKWDIAIIGHNTNDGHATGKPIDCMLKPIEVSSKKGDAVYDPFLGSGTTAVAAESVGRISYSCEIDPMHCEVALRRLEAVTEQVAHKVQ